MTGMPTSGPKQGKSWGVTMMPFAFNSVEAHVIYVKKGACCSNHSHRTKWNRFCVLKGRLRIVQRVGDGTPPDDITDIAPWEIVDAPPGVRHTFKAIEETWAVEFYWAPLDSEDIDRHGTVGGVRSDQSFDYSMSVKLSQFVQEQARRAAGYETTARDEENGVARTKEVEND